MLPAHRLLPGPAIAIFTEAHTSGSLFGLVQPAIRGAVGNIFQVAQSRPADWPPASPRLDDRSAPLLYSTGLEKARSSGASQAIGLAEGHRSPESRGPHRIPASHCDVACLGVEGVLRGAGALPRSVPSARRADLCGGGPYGETLLLRESIRLNGLG